MANNKTVARKSLVNQVLQADGRSVLKEVGTSSRPSAGAAAVQQSVSVMNVLQSGTSINLANTPSVAPGAVVPANKTNTYFIDLDCLGLTALIQASSTEEAWGIFANRYRIGASEREAKITEFTP